MCKGVPTSSAPLCQIASCAERSPQGRGFAVRVLPLDEELPDELPDDELLPDDDDEGGGGVYVLRGRSDAVPDELPCVCV